MIRDFHIPPSGFGPGSQPADDEGELEFMAMPGDMRTYAPHLPDVEPSDVHSAAMSVMSDIASAAARVANGAAPQIFDLSSLDPSNRRLVAETMGEGEVAMKVHGISALSIQESVFAGVWSVAGSGIDRIEVARIPDVARLRAFEPARGRVVAKAGPSVVNAPSILSELEDKSASFDGTLHVVNLTLLPHTEEDLLWLDARLGQGATDVLSRGYGNCRVRATALPHVWRVQFFNSMETLILDTFEVTDVPEVVIAADEDLNDSAKRLVEVLEAIR